MLSSPPRHIHGSHSSTTNEEAGAWKSACSRAPAPPLVGASVRAPSSRVLLSALQYATWNNKPNARPEPTRCYLFVVTELVVTAIAPVVVLQRRPIAKPASTIIIIG